MNRDLLGYSVRVAGRWWATRWFHNPEVRELHAKLCGLDVGTGTAILGCGCKDYQKHIDEYNELVRKGILQYRNFGK